MMRKADYQQAKCTGDVDKQNSLCIFQLHYFKQTTRCLLKDPAPGLLISTCGCRSCCRCTFRVPPFTMTFCLSGWTPVRAKSWALNTTGGSSVFSSTPSNFSLPHLTFTGREEMMNVSTQGEQAYKITTTHDRTISWAATEKGCNGS